MADEAKLCICEASSSYDLSVNCNASVYNSAAFRLIQQFMVFLLNVIRNIFAGQLILVDKIVILEAFSGPRILPSV